VAIVKIKKPIKVAIIGLDGFTWKVADPLLKRGQLPNLQGMIDKGVKSELVVEGPLLSPIIWTTVATGFPPESHGVDYFTRPKALLMKDPFGPGKRLMARSVVYFRWPSGRVPDGKALPDSAKIEFRCRAFKGCPHQKVRLSLNGTELTRIPLSREWKTYRVNVPKRYLTVPRMTLMLDFSSSRSPDKTDRPGEGDRRTLSAEFKYISIENRKGETLFCTDFTDMMCITGDPNSPVSLGIGWHKDIDVWSRNQRPESLWAGRYPDRIMNRTMMKKKPVWEILSELGDKVGSFNWWITWPAQKVRGFIFSDFVTYNLDILSRLPDRDRSLKKGIVYPENVDDCFHYPQQVPADAKKVLALDGVDKKRYSELENGIKKEEYLWNTAMGLYSRFNPDFFAFYTHSPDWIQHRWWDHLGTSMKNDRKMKKCQVDIIGEYYRYLDTLLGRMLKVLDQDTLILLISDHGFKSSGYPSLPGIHEGNGVFVMSGGPVKKMEVTRPPRALDMAPTILFLRGKALPEDMPGIPFLEPLEKDALADGSPERVSTYGDGKEVSVGARLPRSIEETVKERLKHLGYL